MAFAGRPRQQQNSLDAQNAFTLDKGLSDVRARVLNRVFKHMPMLADGRVAARVAISSDEFQIRGTVWFVEPPGTAPFEHDVERDEARVLLAHILAIALCSFFDRKQSVDSKLRRLERLVDDQQRNLSAARQSRDAKQAAYDERVLQGETREQLKGLLDGLKPANAAVTQAENTLTERKGQLKSYVRAKRDKFVILQNAFKAQAALVKKDSAALEAARKRGVKRVVDAKEIQLELSSQRLESLRDEIETYERPGEQEAASDTTTFGQASQATSVGLIRDKIVPLAASTDALEAIVNVPGPLHPNPKDPAFTQVRVDAELGDSMLQVLAHFCTVLHGFGIKYAGERELGSRQPQTRRFELYFRKEDERFVGQQIVDENGNPWSNADDYKATYARFSKDDSANLRKAKLRIQGIVEAIVIGTLDDRLLTSDVLKYLLLFKTYGQHAAVKEGSAFADLCGQPATRFIERVAPMAGLPPVPQLKAGVSEGAEKAVFLQWLEFCVVSTASGELGGQKALKRARDPSEGIVALAAKAVVDGIFREPRGVLPERLYIELVLGVVNPTSESLSELLDEIQRSGDAKFAAIKPLVLKAVAAEDERKRKLEENRRKKSEQDAAQTAAERVERASIVRKLVYDFKTDEYSGADYTLTPAELLLLASGRYFDTYKTEQRFENGMFKYGGNGQKFKEGRKISDLVYFMKRHDPWKEEYREAFKVVAFEVCKFLACISYSPFMEKYGYRRRFARPSDTVFHFLRLVIPGNEIRIPVRRFRGNVVQEAFETSEGVQKDADGFLAKASYENVIVPIMAYNLLPLKLKSVCKKLKDYDCGAPTKEYLQDEASTYAALKKTFAEEERLKEERRQADRKRRDERQKKDAHFRELDELANAIFNKDEEEIERAIDEIEDDADRQYVREKVAELRDDVEYERERNAMNIQELSGSDDDGDSDTRGQDLDGSDDDGDSDTGSQELSGSDDPFENFSESEMSPSSKRELLESLRRR